MSDSSKPFAPKKFLEIKGRRMASIDEGQGAAIVFRHGNPSVGQVLEGVAAFLANRPAQFTGRYAPRRGPD